PRQTLRPYPTLFRSDAGEHVAPAEQLNGEQQHPQAERTDHTEHDAEREPTERPALAAGVGTIEMRAHDEHDEVGDAERVRAVGVGPAPPERGEPARRPAIPRRPGGARGARP